MSQLMVVREALSSNSKIKVLNVEQKVYFPYPNGYWSQTFRFIVAPVKQIVSAEGLNELMFSLVGLEPTMSDLFRESEDTISFGKLYFDEEIGHYLHDWTKQYSLTDPDFNPEGEFEDRKMKVEAHERVALKRRTWVVLYPSVRYAETLIAEERTEYWADKSEFGESRRLLRRG